MHMDFFDLLLVFNAEYPLQHDNDLSSAIRGLWGRSLKKLYCLQKQLDCRGCSMQNCTYYVLFEKKFSSAEQYHPYIIQAHSQAPNRIEARFKFFGWICNHYEKVIFSLLNLHNTTLIRGGTSSKISLQQIYDGLGNLMYSGEDTGITRPKLIKLRFKPQIADEVELILKTPLRQKNQGLLMDRFAWEPFAKSLIHRIRSLDNHFNNNNLNIPLDIDISGVEILHNDTCWSEKIRVSFRQNEKMSIGGLIGSVRLRGISPDMIAVLKLARHLHAGKQCSFGNGEISLRNLSDQKDAPA